MVIDVFRYHETPEATGGLLYVDGLFQCFTLEDQEQTQKVFAETRIPAGTYDLGVRTHGGFHKRYATRFGSMFHKGMIEILDVPGFTDVLIHIGNDDNDTAGCLLVAAGANARGPTLVESTWGYKALYALVIEQLLNGFPVTLNVYDPEDWMPE